MAKNGTYLPSQSIDSYELGRAKSMPSIAHDHIWPDVCNHITVMGEWQ